MRRRPSSAGASFLLNKRGTVPVRDETGRFTGVRPKTAAERLQVRLLCSRMCVREGDAGGGYQWRSMPRGSPSQALSVQLWPAAVPCRRTCLEHRGGSSRAQRRKCCGQRCGSCRQVSCVSVILRMSFFPKGSFLASGWRVIRALNPERCPGAGEIAKVAMKRGLITCQGKTPEATMASALYTDVKRKENTSIFIRPHEGLFGLREWAEQGITFEVLVPLPIADNMEVCATGGDAVSR